MPKQISKQPTTGRFTPPKNEIPYCSTPQTEKLKIKI